MRHPLLAMSATFFALLLPAAGFAEVCSSITVERDQYNPLGTCWESPSTACSSDSQCSGSSKDFCVKAVCENDPSRFCTSDSQCGGASCVEDITFTFDEPLECGRFVNGDWWVAPDTSGEVTVTSMTPMHTSSCESGGEACRNGWGVDLEKGDSPYSGRAMSTSSSPRLPRTFRPGSRPISLLKSIDGGQEACDYPSGSYCSTVLHASVLTVVPSGQTPPANAFRPPYAGPDKPTGYYTVDDVDLSKIPRLSRSQLPSGTSIPSMSAVKKYNTGPFLGINRVNAETYGMVAHNQSTHGYHATRARSTNRHLLALLLENDFANDSVHQQALYRTIQTGIDKSWVLKNWAAHSQPQRRVKDMAVPIMFASFVLGDSSLARTGFPNMSEQDTFYDSPRYGAGHPADYLWGYTCDENTYWSRSSSNKASDKWCGDPYGYAEGTLASYGGSYQQCCSMGPWKGGALFVHLMQMEDVLDVRGFLHVMGRFWDGWASDPDFDQGHWASPDPCAANGSPTGSPSNSCHENHECSCQSGDGRALSMHNRLSNYGGGIGEPGYQDDFANAMWDTFRECASPVRGDGATSATFPCAGMPGGSSTDPEPPPPSGSPPVPPVQILD